jgi:hypothetical protein
VRRRLLSLIVLTALVAVLLPDCGGGNDSGSKPPPSPTPSPTPQPPDPCAAVAQTPPDLEAAGLLAAPGKLLVPADERTDRGGDLYGALWLHEAARRRGITAGLPAAGASVDVGDIAVLQDTGNLILPPNRFDLGGAALRFTPSGAGYVVGTADPGFRQDLGARVSLSDDDAHQFEVPFPFSFFGAGQTQAFVNSDGNVTFDTSDTASTERNVSRALTGPPRIAPFFADLDPSTGGGVFVNAAADAFTVTWCGVRGFDSSQAVTTQLALLPTGAVEMRWNTSTTLTDAVVGLSPGRTGSFDPVDLSGAAASTPAATMIGERFAQNPQLDLVSVGEQFYAAHQDIYDQLVLWTNQRVVTDAFAFETTVANEIHGIGVDIFDEARSFGSGGRLRSLVVMDALGKYPGDPRQVFLGANNTVSVLGQEVGHRWLAYLRFRDANRQRSDALLGRDNAHWSFFVDSDASVMEGNDIEDLGGGSFRTVAAVQRYSLLDQYAMGLVSDSDVKSFFYVEDPTNVQPRRTNVSPPEVGVTFDGTRRDVLIQDVIAVMGQRQPSFRSSPRVHRQAFVYIVSQGSATDQAQVDKVDRIRRAWETFFASAVSGRMRAETRLRPPS